MDYPPLYTNISQMVNLGNRCKTIPPFHNIRVNNNIDT